ncbi:MAG: hypothetical protein ACLFTT_14120 [Candidatus Hydrogenedentota bacterium]
MQYLSAHLLCRAAGSAAAEGATPFEEAGVHVVIGNSAAAEVPRAGYNGMFALTAPGRAMAPFVPAYAGPQLEPYFDALPRPHNNAVSLEPRTYFDTAQRYARAR